MTYSTFLYLFQQNALKLIATQGVTNEENNTRFCLTLTFEHKPALVSSDYTFVDMLDNRPRALILSLLAVSGLVSNEIELKHKYILVFHLALL